MRVIRRALQVFALVGTLLVGVVALALVVSQTPWFKDWLRRYAMRQADDYLHGQLTIGGLGGNLFFGVDLTDVALVVSGERVISVKDLQLDYSVFDFISRGIVLDDIRINQPRVMMRRDPDGSWNLANLVRKQEREADREGPGRPIAVGSIGISAGEFIIDDPESDRSDTVGTSGAGEPPAGVRLPRAIRAIDARLSFDYEPVRFTVVMDHISFRTISPSLDVNRVQGTVAVRDDDLHLEDITIHTAESALNIDGAVERYATNPVLKLTAGSDGVSLQEIARVVPALAPYRLQPAFTVRARGPLEALALDFQARSEAGGIAADVIADLMAPQRAVRGEVKTTALNLAPLLNDPQQKSHITGVANLDITIPDAGVEQARGTFSFTGPRVAVAGYEASEVRADGRIAGRRITLDAQAHAYGSRATARGVIVTPDDGRPLAFSLDGRAADLDLRRLPASLDVPRLETNIDAEYHVEGAGQRIAGNATLGRSTVEGATLAQGTVVRFTVAGPGQVEYAARGAVTALDLQRVGRALDLSALAEDQFRSDINAGFDLHGRGTAPATMTIAASGQLTDSSLMGGRVPRLDFETGLSGGSLHVRANGELAGFDPAAIGGRPELEGTVGGRVDVDLTLPDAVAGRLDPAAIGGTARVELAPGTIGALTIEGGTVDASFNQGIVELRQANISGRDLKVEADGELALAETGHSNLKYRLQSSSLEDIGTILGQPLQGSVAIDGTISGNRSDLRLAGTLDGSNLAYEDHGALDINSAFLVAIPDLAPARARVEADTHATFARVAGIEIQEIVAHATYEQNRASFTATIRDQGRELETTGDVVLHPDHSEIHVPALSVRTEGLEWRAVGSDAAIQYGADRLSFQNVTLQSGGQRLSVEGTVATGGEQAAGTLLVRADNIDLPELQRLLLDDRGIGGILDANARVTGVLSAPRVEGSVSIANGSFRDFTFESLTSEVEYTSSGIVVDARLQQTPEHWLTVVGSAPMSLFRPEPTARAEHVPASAEDRVDLRVESSEIHLGVIQGFTPQLTDVQGSVQANVRVFGSGRDPHVEGTVAVRGGAFAVPALGTRYRGLDTVVELTADRAVVPRFQVTDEEGNPLTVAGELAVHDRAVGAVDITFDADSFELIDNELGDIGVDARLKLTGELRRPRVQGEIKIENGRIEVDRVLAMVAGPYPTDVDLAPPVERGAEAAASEAGATEAARASLRTPVRTLDEPPQEHAAAPEAAAAGGGTMMDALALDVRLQIPDNLVLRGRDLRPGGPGGIALGNINMTVGGDLRVTKQPNEDLRLVGTINTVRGFYEFQGRRFTVDREGRIRFAGLDTLNPTLDVRATRIISGVEARVHVKGTAREPELELSSDPPQDEADILSLIVFNRSINSLNEGERVSLAQRAGAVAGGFVTAPLAQSIGRALDVDLFEIEPIETGGQLGAGITLGQQVGERLFVRFHQEFGPQDTSEFIIEYQLASFLRLQATAAPGGGQKASRVALRRVERAGADLIFFFSY